MRNPSAHLLLREADTMSSLRRFLDWSTITYSPSRMLASEAYAVAWRARRERAKGLPLVGLAFVAWEAAGPNGEAECAAREHAARFAADARGYAEAVVEAVRETRGEDGQ